MPASINRFHYITQDLVRRSHQDQVLTACEAGIKWVQLRMKDKSFSESLQIAQEVKKITDQFSAALIINDSPEIAINVNADGVHLGKEDMNVQEARGLLGDEKIIGFSVHSREELTAAQNLRIDYFGLGPFRFTTTKKNLDAVLGIEKIAEIIAYTRKGITSKPVIVIGGILPGDVKSILSTGAHGIAVSSAINHSENPKQVIDTFLNEMKFFDTEKIIALNNN